MSTRIRFEGEAGGNSEMVYWGNLIGLFQVKFQAGTHTTWSKYKFSSIFSGSQTSLLHGTNEEEGWFGQKFNTTPSFSFHFAFNIDPFAKWPFFSTFENLIFRSHPLLFKKFHFVRGWPFFSLWKKWRFSVAWITCPTKWKKKRDLLLVHSWTIYQS